MTVRRTLGALGTAAIIGVAGCSAGPANAPVSEPEAAEATSLLGQPLARPALPDEARERMEAQLAEARTEWERVPDDVDAIIWLGRRTAYLGRYREAIDIFTDGLDRHPDEPRLYRHRGHRFLSVRELDRAIEDFERAVVLIDGQPDQVEPDGQPNARNTPTSTLHSNIWYHLALARYLTGDFDGAADGWRRARDAVDNPDNLVATSHWLYVSLRRTGQMADAEDVLAPIRDDLDVIENGSYHSLLLLYRGGRTVEDVLGPAGEGAAGSAVRYGVGAWHLINGRDDEARRVWSGILDGPDWPSFGFIAAEAEAARAAASAGR